MLTESQKEKLYGFFRAVEKVKIQKIADIPGPSKGKVWDLGLVILEENTRATFEDVVFAYKEQFQSKGAHIIELNKYTEYGFDQSFAEALYKVFSEKVWLFIKLVGDPSPNAIHYFNQLSRDNAVTISHFMGKKLFRLVMPEESRIIVIAKRQFIEEGITFPYFYTLFGPVCALE